MILGNKQFLFTKHPKTVDSEIVLTEVISDFTLYYNTNLQVTKSKTESKQLYLLGHLFSYEDSLATNKTLLDLLASTEDLEAFFKLLDSFYGEYVIIYKTEQQFLILNDCCAQNEIYYNVDFTEFGSQSCLLSDKTEVKNHPYYNSALFRNKKLFISETTPYINVKHLLANHYLEINTAKNIRFYPTQPLEILDINIVAKKAAKQLKGYITAISKRHDLILPVTGGFDSRLLFLASLDLGCEYYVSKHKNMSSNHYDITIAKQLCNLYGKTLHIIEDTSANSIILESAETLDVPRQGSFPKITKNKAIINGNISEVARNYFNYHTNLSGKKLALLNGFSQNTFVIEKYQDWLSKNKEIFLKHNFNLLDTFYWEEKMSIWTAKAKSEANAMDLNLFSPFNSRALLHQLLNTNRKDRDKFTSKLYKAITTELTDKSGTVNHITTNPDFERKRALILKKLRLFTYFDALRLKVRILKRVVKK